MSNRQRMDHVTESPVKKRQTDLLEVRKLTTRAYAKHALELSQVARQNDRFQVRLCLNKLQSCIHRNNANSYDYCYNEDYEITYVCS